MSVTDRKTQTQWDRHRAAADASIASGGKKHARMVFHPCAGMGWLFWTLKCYCRRNRQCQLLCRSVQGFRSSDTPIFLFSIAGRPYSNVSTTVIVQLRRWLHHRRIKAQKAVWAGACGACVRRRGAVQLREQQSVGGRTQRLSQVWSALTAALDGAVLDHRRQRNGRLWGRSGRPILDTHTRTLHFPQSHWRIRIDFFPTISGSVTCHLFATLANWNLQDLLWSHHYQ